MKKLVLILSFFGLVFGAENSSNLPNSQGSSSVPKITTIDLGSTMTKKDSGCEADLPNDVFSGGVKICTIDENETDMNATANLDGNSTQILDANLTAIEANATQTLQNSQEEVLHKSNSGVVQGKNGGVKLPFD